MIVDLIVNVIERRTSVQSITSEAAKRPSSPSEALAMIYAAYSGETRTCSRFPVCVVSFVLSFVERGIRVRKRCRKRPSDRVPDIVYDTSAKYIGAECATFGQRTCFPCPCRETYASYVAEVAKTSGGPSRDQQTARILANSATAAFASHIWGYAREADASEARDRILTGRLRQKS